MYETHVTVQGRLVADPVVKPSRNGPFTSFRIAQSERHPDRAEPGRWVDSDPSFYEVSVFRGMGENAARSLRKGHPVVVTGKQRVRQFRREDGSYGASVELDASGLGHDLRWGVTAYTRNGDLAPAAAGGGGGAAGGGFGDPERDVYVVDASGPAATGVGDSGPLTRPTEAA
ncbi:single-stranded DNA-binding protein [Phycicoccus flavus]|uniref:Single-stranded DNA-binding protein n=1 Tax=Phycicoccus flavus TaxID=2502783 RepID=A0A8T6R0Q6_9MICO|nr:single-stranded DNA-binding protein [Phycicoccus flavus]NHA67517.1 single-stranded DNA-binding protein [Phycicoccus flavus]